MGKNVILFLALLCAILEYTKVEAATHDEENAILNEERRLEKRFIHPFITTIGVSFNKMLDTIREGMDQMGMDNTQVTALQKLYNTSFSTDNLLFKRKCLNLIIRICNFLLKYLPEEPVQSNETFLGPSKVHYINFESNGVPERISKLIDYVMNEETNDISNDISKTTETNQLSKLAKRSVQAQFEVSIPPIIPHLFSANLHFGPSRHHKHHEITTRPYIHFNTPPHHTKNIQVGVQISAPGTNEDYDEIPEEEIEETEIYDCEDCPQERDEFKRQKRETSETNPQETIEEFEESEESSKINEEMQYKNQEMEIRTIQTGKFVKAPSTTFEEKEENKKNQKTNEEARNKIRERSRTSFLKLHETHSNKNFFNGAEIKIEESAETTKTNEENINISDQMVTEISIEEIKKTKNKYRGRVRNRLFTKPETHFKPKFIKNPENNIEENKESFKSNEEKQNDKIFPTENPTTLHDEGKSTKNVEESEENQKTTTEVIEKSLNKYNTNSRLNFKLKLPQKKITQNEETPKIQSAISNIKTSESKIEENEETITSNSKPFSNLQELNKRRFSRPPFPRMPPKLIISKKPLNEESEEDGIKEENYHLAVKRAAMQLHAKTIEEKLEEIIARLEGREEMQKNEEIQIFSLEEKLEAIIARLEKALGTENTTTTQLEEALSSISSIMQSEEMKELQEFHEEMKKQTIEESEDTPQTTVQGVFNGKLSVKKGSLIKPKKFNRKLKESEIYEISSISEEIKSTTEIPVEYVTDIFVTSKSISIKEDKKNEEMDDNRKNEEMDTKFKENEENATNNMNEEILEVITDDPNEYRKTNEETGREENLSEISIMLESKSEIMSKIRNEENFESTEETIQVTDEMSTEEVPNIKEFSSLSSSERKQKDLQIKETVDENEVKGNTSIQNNEEVNEEMKKESVNFEQNSFPTILKSRIETEDSSKPISSISSDENILQENEFPSETGSEEIQTQMNEESAMDTEKADNFDQTLSSLDQNIIKKSKLPLPSSNGSEENQPEVTEEFEEAMKIVDQNESSGNEEINQEMNERNTEEGPEIPEDVDTQTESTTISMPEEISSECRKVHIPSSHSSISSSTVESTTKEFVHEENPNDILLIFPEGYTPSEIEKLTEEMLRDQTPSQKNEEIEEVNAESTVLDPTISSDSVAHLFSISFGTSNKISRDHGPPTPPLSTVQKIMNLTVVMDNILQNVRRNQNLNPKLKSKYALVVVHKSLSKTSEENEEVKKRFKRHLGTARFASAIKNFQRISNFQGFSDYQVYPVQNIWRPKIWKRPEPNFIAQINKENFIRYSQHRRPLERNENRKKEENKYGVIETSKGTLDNSDHNQKNQINWGAKFGSQSNFWNKHVIKDASFETEPSMPILEKSGANQETQKGIWFSKFATPSNFWEKHFFNDQNFKREPSVPILDHSGPGLKNLAKPKYFTEGNFAPYTNFWNKNLHTKVQLSEFDMQKELSEFLGSPGPSQNFQTFHFVPYNYFWAKQNGGKPNLKTAQVFDTTNFAPAINFLTTKQFNSATNLFRPDLGITGQDSFKLQNFANNNFRPNNAFFEKQSLEKGNQDNSGPLGSNNSEFGPVGHDIIQGKNFDTNFFDMKMNFWMKQGPSEKSPSGQNEVHNFANTKFGPQNNFWEKQGPLDANLNSKTIEIGFKENKQNQNIGNENFQQKIESEITTGLLDEMTSGPLSKVSKEPGRGNSNTQNFGLEDTSQKKNKPPDAILDSSKGFGLESTSSQANFAPKIIFLDKNGIPEDDQVNVGRSTPQQKLSEGTTQNFATVNLEFTNGIQPQIKIETKTSENLDAKKEEHQDFANVNFGPRNDFWEKQDTKIPSKTEVIKENSLDFLEPFIFDDEEDDDSDDDDDDIIDSEHPKLVNLNSNRKTHFSESQNLVSLSNHLDAGHSKKAGPSRFILRQNFSDRPQANQVTPPNLETTTKVAQAQSKNILRNKSRTKVMQNVVSIRPIDFRNRINFKTTTKNPIEDLKTLPNLSVRFGVESSTQKSIDRKYSKFLADVDRGTTGLEVHDYNKGKHEKSNSSFYLVSSVVHPKEMEVQKTTEKITTPELVVRYLGIKKISKPNRGDVIESYEDSSDGADEAAVNIFPKFGQKL